MHVDSPILALFNKVVKLSKASGPERIYISHYDNGELAMFIS